MFADMPARIAALHPGDHEGETEGCEVCWLVDERAGLLARAEQAEANLTAARQPYTATLSAAARCADANEELRARVASLEQALTKTRDALDAEKEPNPERGWDKAQRIISGALGEGVGTIEAIEVDIRDLPLAGRGDPEEPT